MDDEWRADGFFVEIPLVGEAAFAEEVAVVGAEDDDGVVSEALLSEFGEDVADDVVDYAVRIVGATRGGPDSHDLVQRYVSYGGSPRASQNIILGAKARALLDGRFHVDFADVQATAAPVLRHRLILNYKARAEQITSDDVTAALIKTVTP